MDTVLDPHRLAVLHDLEILDTPPELAYDDIATLAATSTGSAIAAVNFIDGDRQWTKAAVGLEPGHGAQISADTAFCAATVRAGRDLMCIPDTLESDEWRDHPLVTGPPYIRFYAGATIVVAHQPVGVVCVHGDQPRPITRQDERSLLGLARQVANQLELRRRDGRMLEPGLTDPLTGVANRRLLLDRLEMAIAQRRRRGGEVGVVVCTSVDAGQERPELADRYLTRIAERLREASDGADTTVSRSAAHEFTLVLPGLAHAGELDTAVARIRTALQSPEPSAGSANAVAVNISARLVRDGETASTVLLRD